MSTERKGNVWKQLERLDELRLDLERPYGKQVTVKIGSSDKTFILPEGVRSREFAKNVSGSRQIQTMIQEYLLFEENITEEDYQLIEKAIGSLRGRGKGDLFFNKNVSSETKELIAEVIYDQLDEKDRDVFIRERFKDPEKVNFIIKRKEQGTLKERKKQLGSSFAELVDYLNEEHYKNTGGIKEKVEKVEENSDFFIGGIVKETEKKTQVKEEQEEEQTQEKTVTEQFAKTDFVEDVEAAVKKQDNIQAIETGGTNEQETKDLIKLGIQSAGISPDEEEPEIIVREPLKGEPEVTTRATVVSPPPLGIETVHYLDPEGFEEEEKTNIERLDTGVGTDTINTPSEIARDIDRLFTESIDMDQIYTDVGISAGVSNTEPSLQEDGEPLPTEQEPQVPEGNRNDYVTETNPYEFKVVYHEIPFTIFFGTLKNPNIDIQLDRDVTKISKMKDYDSEYLSQLVVECSRGKFLVEDVVKGDTQELRELLQLYFCVFRNLQTGPRFLFGKVPIKELAKLAETVDGGPSGPSGPSGPNTTSNSKRLNQRFQELDDLEANQFDPNNTTTMPVEEINKRANYVSDDQGLMKPSRPFKKMEESIAESSKRKLVIHEPIEPPSSKSSNVSGFSVKFNVPADRAYY